MTIEECKFYNKETGCIECKQVVVKNLVDIISWQDEKLEKIEEVITEFSKEDIITLPDLTAKDNYNLIAKQYAEPITKIIQIIRGEE